MVMGGRFCMQISDDSGNIIEYMSPDVEKYFRPSALPVLNDRSLWNLIDRYYGKELLEINLPEKLMNTPEDTILNYFSILREAANPQKGKGAGCGTIGLAGIPYPVSYKFLSSSYQKNLPYKQYLDIFQNILHISLIKYRELPDYDNTDNIIRYFVELETIEGTEKNTAVFAYYYGFLEFINENGQYKISDLELYGEDYLCAPYHGWVYDAQANVQIRYGEWCSMINEMYPVLKKDYIINISFKGTDGKDYLIVFYQLTNDMDIEVAQYKREEGSSWQLIRLEPEKCIRGGGNTPTFSKIF